MSGRDAKYIYIYFKKWKLKGYVRTFVKKGLGKKKHQVFPSSQTLDWGNVGIAIINHQLLMMIYHRFMVIRGMVYYCYTNITQPHTATLRLDWLTTQL